MKANAMQFRSAGVWVATVIGLLLCMGLLMLANGSSAEPVTGRSALEPTPEPTEVWLTEANNGEHIYLYVGQVLGINLEANPSTGYRWDVVDVNQTMLQSTGQPEYQSQSSLLGAPARQLFRFNAVGEGEDNLRLDYHRPWWRVPPPAGTFSVQVTVQLPSAPVPAPPAEKKPALFGPGFVHTVLPQGHWHLCRTVAWTQRCFRSSHPALRAAGLSS